MKGPAHQEAEDSSPRGCQKAGARPASKNGHAATQAAGTSPKRVRAILQKLDEAYPEATCALVHHNPFQLLIATILSAQCTDVRVNQVTPSLFAKYPKPEDLAYANPRETRSRNPPDRIFPLQDQVHSGRQQEDRRGILRPGSPHHGAVAHLAGRRPQNGQRRPRHGLRHRLGNRRRHARACASPAGWTSPATPIPKKSSRI